MDYNSHVFWYFIDLCKWFPKDSPERMASFVAAHHEFMKGTGMLEACYDYHLAEKEVA